MCPRCGSAPRSLPRICSRGTKQRNEPLHSFRLTTFPFNIYQCALTIYGNLPVPDEINFVSDDNDGFRVEVTRLPEALEQGLGLPESGRVGDAEDNEHTVALRPSLPTSLLILARAKRLLPTVSSFNAHLRLFWIHVKEDQLSFPILKHDADTRLRDGGPGGLIGVDIVGGEEVVDQGGLANPTATHHHHPAKKDKDVVQIATENWRNDHGFKARKHRICFNSIWHQLFGRRERIYNELT